MNENLYKFPRLYIPAPLAAGGRIALPDAQTHYLKNVMRRKEGESIRLFNGTDGEWLATFEALGRHEVTCALTEQVKEQPVRKRRVHLYFTPLKKDRLHTLIEKAVELDATDLHPVITNRTEVREIKHDKIMAHITEAAEQCERMDLPVLHDIVPLARAFDCDYPVYAGLERSDAVPLKTVSLPDGDIGALIGPVGGWDEGERALLSETKGIVPVTLGPNVLRSETAVAAILALIG